MSFENALCDAFQTKEKKKIASKFRQMYSNSMKLIMAKSTHGTLASQLEPLITRVNVGIESIIRLQLKLGITAEKNLQDHIDTLIEEKKEA